MADSLNCDGSTRLDSIPEIKEKIINSDYDVLVRLHILLFGTSSKVQNIANVEKLKEDILSFSGFSFAKGSEGWKQKEFLLSLFSESSLQEYMRMLCIEHTGDTDATIMIKEIMEFLASLKDDISEIDERETQVVSHDDEQEETEETDEVETQDDYDAHQATQQPSPIADEVDSAETQNKVKKKIRRPARLLPDFIVPALEYGTYGMLLKWDDRNKGIFKILWLRKERFASPDNTCAVFIAWDIMRGRPLPRTSEKIVESKQRLKAAFRKLNNILELEPKDGYKRYQITDFSPDSSSFLENKRLGMWKDDTSPGTWCLSTPNVEKKECEETSDVELVHIKQKPHILSLTSESLSDEYAASPAESVEGEIEDEEEATIERAYIKRKLLDDSGEDFAHPVEESESAENNKFSKVHLFSVKRIDTEVINASYQVRN